MPRIPARLAGRGCRGSRHTQNCLALGPRDQQCKPKPFHKATWPCLRAATEEREEVACELLSCEHELVVDTCDAESSRRRPALVDLQNHQSRASDQNSRKTHQTSRPIEDLGPLRAPETKEQDAQKSFDAKD